MATGDGSDEWGGRGGRVCPGAPLPPPLNANAPAPGGAGASGPGRTAAHGAARRGGGRYELVAGVIRISTRRFSACPSRLALEAIGSLSPLP